MRRAKASRSSLGVNRFAYPQLGVVPRIVQTSVETPAITDLVSFSLDGMSEISPGVKSSEFTQGRGWLSPDVETEFLCLPSVCSVSFCFLNRRQRCERRSRGIESLTVPVLILLFL
jgi:hypothetical protein